MKWATIFLVLALGGCASTPERVEEAVSKPADRAAAQKLYGDESAVVHATEFPVTSAPEGMARGDQAWRKGQLDLAVYLYVQSLAYDAKNVEPLLRIGAIQERRGNRALAERAFEMALQLDPRNPGINERLGLLYLEGKRDVAARPLLERAVTLDAKRWQSHDGLGIAADRRKDFAAAISHYDAAHALEPRAVTVVNNRGYSRYLAGDFAGAEADFRAALQMGGHPGTWTNLGRALARQGRYDEALDCFRKEADAAHAYNLLGEEALEAGELARARDFFADAVSAAPRHFQAAHDNLELANERIESAGNHPTRVTTSDAKVFAKGAYIGELTQGREVAVLFNQGNHSLVRYQESDGSERTGWVTSNILADQRALR